MTQTPRQIAFLALRAVQRGTFADAALDRLLRQSDLAVRDRRLVTELVYGSIRRQRTLDALIDQFGKKTAAQQPPDLRLILRLGLYQLRYLNQIPAPAVVDTAVELAKQNRLQRLAGVVNGVLRQYLRAAQARSAADSPADPQPGPTAIASSPPKAVTRVEKSPDPLQLPTDPIQRLALLHSYPDWIVQVWRKQLDLPNTERLCQWFNQAPHIDLRVNPLRTDVAAVEAAFATQQISTQRVPFVPNALRLSQPTGPIQALPGFDAGWWTVQDSSAQLVAHLLDPQPGEVIIDACAAPGGKTTHLAELMENQGTIWACDRQASRLKKLTANQTRLGHTMIQTWAGDSREFPPSEQSLQSLSDQPLTQALADRVLLDAPCSGLGTLHRHADARWRQTPDTVQGLTTLQTNLLNHAATWVKPGGKLVYATCTLHPAENEAVIQAFLSAHPHWSIAPSERLHQQLPADWISPEGWIKVWPHQQDMDGFFMVCLERSVFRGN